jgi:hypothetical protein
MATARPGSRTSARSRLSSPGWPRCSAPTGLSR